MASPGPETVGFGGNTACVEVRGREGEIIILDAGTGIRRLGTTLDGQDRIDILLSHLHTDHIQGLGFFEPLFQPDREVHIWGPSSPTMDLRKRLARYLSSPLFPVYLRELPSKVSLHDLPLGEFEIGGIRVTADLIVHPGQTLGFRLREESTLAYLSDHEPALGARKFPQEPSWTSGFRLAEGVDMLIHDSQYDEGEYATRAGWGHSSLDHAVAFAQQTGARKLVTFHHDPSHSDSYLERLHRQATERSGTKLSLVAGVEGLTAEI